MAAESGTEDPVIAPDLDDRTGCREAARCRTCVFSRGGRRCAGRPLREAPQGDRKRAVGVPILPGSSACSNALQPDRQPIGRFVPPSREAVRFSPRRAWPFPPASFKVSPGLLPDAPLLQLNFMGMTGPNGVMPLYYTELIMERLRQKDRALGAFLDLFNHRIVSLFYQAWEKYRVTVAYERDERDRFSHILMDVVGLGTAHLQGRQIIRDDSILFYAGLVGLHTRPAAALRQILSGLFRCPRRDRAVGRRLASSRRK